MQIEIFGAEAQNIWQFLQTSSQGCYILAYQRPRHFSTEASIAAQSGSRAMLKHETPPKIAVAPDRILGLAAIATDQASCLGRRKHRSICV